MGTTKNLTQTTEMPQISTETAKTVNASTEEEKVA